MFENLLQKDLDITFFNNSSSNSFKIENFLSNEQYSEINNNIPKFKVEDYKKLNTDFENKNSQHQLKFHINEVSKNNYDKYVYGNSVLNEFTKTIKNPIFINKLIKKFFYKILFSRIYDKKTLLKLLLRKNKAVDEKKNVFYEKFIYNNFISTVEFAYMFNGAESFPHTDGMKKVMSLMLYFPDDSFSNEVKKNLGTTFYNSKEYGLQPIDIIGKASNFEESKKFKERNKIELQLPFEKNTIFGFIKSHRSWHSVEKIKIPEKSIRKNININILLV